MGCEKEGEQPIHRAQFYTTTTPVLRQGRTALSLVPILVYRILIFPNVPYSCLKFLSSPVVSSFAEENPDGLLKINQTLAGV